ncbi:hypothetical protein DAPPUDRAFT_106708 [Daphnia pulex]|uniref:Uncharacterized protein n=1 Tax=Daphnia pulex TaxID=6669 RepID=E9GUB5_DAPPU|nr:hypothetical protein DAPPUDRAFT_106708 [Daphnia pulex]|eukprot:EFX76805.1 hypothetical protein DAPPUDRAFT_106708 [Daphnia pulex]
MGTTIEDEDSSEESSGSDVEIVNQAEFLSSSKEVIRMEMVPNDLEFFVSWPTTPGYKAYERDCQNAEKTLDLCTMMTLVNKRVPDDEFFRRQIKELSYQKIGKTCYEHATYELLKSFYARIFRRRKEWGELFTMQSLATWHRE